MNFQRKLLLMTFVALIVVLIWPKGQEEATPETEQTQESREMQSSEMEMRTTPETRRSEVSDEETQAQAEEAALDELAEVPLSEDLEGDAQRRPPASSPVSGLTRQDQAYLQERGVEDPRQILDDLLGRSELLPQDSMAGGNMRFVREETRLLSQRWVLAGFSDGNTQGQALYEFEVSPGGELIWVLLSHYSQRVD